MDIPLDIPLRIFLDESFSVFKYSSFNRGYHIYNDRLQPTVSDDFLHWEEEKENEYDKRAVAIMYDSFHLNTVVGHFLLYWNELANKCLKFLNYHIRAVVTVLLKRMNSGIGLGLEISADYFFHGENRVIKWFKKFIQKLDICCNVKVEKMHEIACEICLFTKTFQKHVLVVLYCPDFAQN